MKIRIVRYRNGIGIHGTKYGVNILCQCKKQEIIGEWWFVIGPFEFIRFNDETWFENNGQRPQ